MTPSQIITAVAFLVAIVVAAHAVLNKRDARSALYWVVLSLLSPFAGPVLYLLFGINRVERRAKRIQKRRAPHLLLSRRGARNRPPGMSQEMSSLVKFMDSLTSMPVVPGNSVEPLVNGEVAYPAMIEAIDNAQESITMCTYIFERDEAGKMFAEAMGRARERGVEVRVLIDDVGALYGSRGIEAEMRSHGVTVATFLPTRLPGRFWHWNLRNHRKLLIIDGRYGFTGGMNVRHRHFVETKFKHAVKDVHFRIHGPVIDSMQQVFAEDWAFATEEELNGEPWFRDRIDPAGDVWARALPAGPDENIDKLRHAFHGAIACTRRSLCVVTPFFLPDPGLVTALKIAAMRGIEVDIVVPSRNHTRFVQWASMETLRQLIEAGCRVWQTPPPFDHSKLLLIDEEWVYIGSGNWDTRSLRLNFEFNLECYSDELAKKLTEIAREKIAASEALTVEMIDARPMAIKLRDGLARLWSPLL